jgi:hypothetical protein
MKTKSSFGARVSFFKDGKVLIKQTHNNGPNKRHTIHRLPNGEARERHLKFEMKAIYEALRLARDGKLTEIRGKS